VLSQNRMYINYGLGSLLALRIAHSELGIRQPQGMGIGRPLGYYGTQTIVATLAGYLVYLVKDYWQAF
jgi:hypothetical protein